MKLITTVKYIILLIGITCLKIGFCQETSEDVLATLDEVIANSDYFVNKKLAKIDEIKRTGATLSDTINLNDSYTYYLSLCHEFQTFKFDSAFHYADQLNKVAHGMNDREMIALARIEFANILISAGIFNEALDTLKSIRLDEIPDKVKAAYYQVLSRGYFDMESFSQSKQFALLYREKGMNSYDSAMFYIPKSSWEYQSLYAQKSIKLGENDTAIVILEHLTSVLLKLGRY